MKIGIVGASICDLKLDPNQPYVAIDGGLQTLINQHIEPIAIIGDFDSLENHDLLKQYDPVVLPCIKDDTDLAKGIDYALKNKYNEINLFGVTNGRLDHFFAVMCLLIRFREHSIYIYDAQNKIYLLTQGTYTITKDHYKYLSFFAVNETQLSIDGCFYPLKDYHLTNSDPLCVSNEILDNEAIISTSGDLIVVQSNNKE